MDRFLQWREVLQLAPDIKTVEAIMRDYAEALGPVVGTLPEDCQRALRGEADVQATAVVLLQEELRFGGSEEARAVLHEIAYTFASAAVRITLLYSRPAKATAVAA
jgi:hypothetical protein